MRFSLLAEPKPNSLASLKNQNYLGFVRRRDQSIIVNNFIA